MSGKAVVATEGEAIVGHVRERYGRIAEGEGSGCSSNATPARPSCCGSAESVSVRLGYKAEELEALPEGADLGLGCGAPLEHLALQPGETVLDLGSGPGLDALLAARRVGPQGRVIGVDMTPAMLERARRNAERGGYANVEFREGRLEALPVEDASVDAVTSNCVINLVPDKAAVFREVARVLKPGGRLVIADIVLDGALPPAVEKDLYAYVGCIAGAAQREAYFGQLRSAGLGEPTLLRDIDQLAAMASAAPEEAKGLLERTGVSLAELQGKVHSVTFRATKPATSPGTTGCCA